MLAEGFERLDAFLTFAGERPAFVQRVEKAIEALADEMGQAQRRSPIRIGKGEQRFGDRCFRARKSLQASAAPGIDPVAR